MGTSGHSQQKMQTTELRNEAEPRDVPFSKNVVCGLVTPERTWTLGHSSSTQGDVAEQNADVMAKPVTVNPVKTTERTTNP